MGMKSWKQARQGDVLLIRTSDETPHADHPRAFVPLEDGRAVAAHGEVTGHRHCFPGEHVTLFRDASGGDATAVVHELTNLLHEDANRGTGDHDPIPVAPGTLIVRRQLQYVRRRVERVVD
jgi:hypothetical protein